MTSAHKQPTMEPTKRGDGATSEVALAAGDAARTGPIRSKRGFLASLWSLVTILTAISFLAAFVFSMSTASDQNEILIIFLNIPLIALKSSFSVLVTVLAVEGVKSFLKENPSASIKDIVDAVKNQQMSSALKSHERIHVFMYSVITTDFFKKKEIEKHAPVIEKITNGGIEMQRHLISSVEGLCVQHIPPKFFPVLLKQLFDADVLAEDVILEWLRRQRSRRGL